MARQGIFLIPLLWILTPLLGMWGVQLAQPISDVLTFACAIPLQLRVLRELSAAPDGALPQPG